MPHRQHPLLLAHAGSSQVQIAPWSTSLPSSRGVQHDTDGCAPHAGSHAERHAPRSAQSQRSSRALQARSTVTCAGVWVRLGAGRPRTPGPPSPALGYRLGWALAGPARQVPFHLRARRAGRPYPNPGSLAAGAPGGCARRAGGGGRLRTLHAGSPPTPAAMCVQLGSR